MKRLTFLCLAMVILAGLTGCGLSHRLRPWARSGDAGCEAPERGPCCAASGEASGEACVDPDRCRNRDGCNYFNPTPKPILASRCRDFRPRAESEAAASGPAAAEAAASGPAAGAVAYPYYTTRGPRDFLAKNPPSIGP
jgi:hypothetical protein